MTKTAVVIPNWNGKRLLEKNLPAVLGCGFDEIIVVDDASSDDSVQFIQMNYPQIRVIKNDKNVGFSGTVNNGVSATNADIVFLLNSDVIPKSDIIRPVVAHFKDPEIFGVSLHEEGYWWAKPRVERGYLVHQPGTPTQAVHNTFWISGGSGAFRKKMWDKLGGMDVLFSPFYWEDLDLSFRALKRGWKLMWEPRAIVEHKHESTINPSNFPKRYLNYIKERNELLFQWKHLPTIFLLTRHMAGITWRLRYPGYIMVLLLALAKLPAVIVRRSQEKMNSRLDYEDILEQFT